MRLLLLVITGAFGLAPALAAAPPPAKPPELSLRLAQDGWGEAPRDNAEAVLRSAAKQLLVHFPGVRLEPIQVQPRGGPITLFKRTNDGYVVVKLSTEGLAWDQYSFQFAHEMCHVLCDLVEDETGQLWFEESVCELASLYALRTMAVEWKTSPPYPNWKSYSKSLTAYAQKRIDAHPLPDGQTLAQWFERNADALAKNPTDRDRNTVAAAALVPLFEKEPRHWMAVHYLNRNKPRQKQTFAQRLQNWHDQTPAEHQAFVREIGKQFGIEVAAAAAAK